ncbi:MAG: YeeE/YedE family protein [Nitrososphaeria archaeon]|nr:YeeE/YedE family protein [Nitrososphaeria archaeon]
MASFKVTFKRFFDNIFREPWPEYFAGILLGFVNIVFYAWALKPYTIFSGYQNWGQHIYSLINLNWISGSPLASVLEDKTSVGIIGLFFGASIAAIISKEFRIRLPSSRIQVVEAVLGGILMSLGVVLSFGCNWGGFFSAITALSLHGWAMFSGLLIGGYLGQKYIIWKVSFATRMHEETFKVKSSELGGRHILKRRLAPIFFAIEAITIILIMAYYSFGPIKDAGLYAVILLFGIIVGIIIQRSRFCFTTAFRDLFFGPEFQRSIRLHKGIILGLLAGVTGGFVLKYRGFVEPLNYVAPVSLTNILGGIIFAFGMVLAGACASGILWRAGEGHVNAFITIFTAVLAYPILRKSFNFTGIGFFIPNIGWTNGMILTYMLLFLYLLFILYLEGRKS